MSRAAPALTPYYDLTDVQEVWPELVEDVNDPGEPLVLPDPPHSASRFQLLLECPRHFWCRYIARIPDPSDRQDPFDTGTRVHEGIEAGCRRVLETWQPNEFILDAVTRACAGLDSTRDERKVRRIMRCINNVYRWMLNHNLWSAWGIGVVNVEQPFAIDSKERYLAWDGDLGKRPARADLCFILDLIVRLQWVGHAYIYDWKSGWTRRRPIVRGLVDPQLLLYAYGMFCADHRLQTIDATFFNVMWGTPEPGIRFPRDLTLEMARSYIASCSREMHRRPPGELARWEPRAGKACFFCSYSWDCAARQGERFTKARDALTTLPPDWRPFVADAPAASRHRRRRA